jgi:hypothetical protein
MPHSIVTVYRFMCPYLQGCQTVVYLCFPVLFGAQASTCAVATNDYLRSWLLYWFETCRGRSPAERLRSAQRRIVHLHQHDYICELYNEHERMPRVSGSSDGFYQWLFITLGSVSTG